MDYCARHQEDYCFYIDTEFVGEESYLPRLEVIQVLAGNEVAVIDYQAVHDPEPLWSLLHREDSEIVLHSGSQDLSLLYFASRKPVTNVFDTQIAAAFLGMGEQPGYADLVNQVTGVALAKSQSYSSWSRRPLTEAQISYAADDVRYLPEVYQWLKQELNSLGRLEWVKQAFQQLEDNAAAESTPAEELYLRIKGAGRLDRKDLAILRELAIWRDEEARSQNRPLQRILRDEILVHLARQKPKSMQDLRAMRGFPVNQVDHLGPDILGAVKQGLNKPKEQWPVRLEGKPLDPKAQQLSSLLSVLLRIRAVENRIAPSLIASSSDLEALAALGVEARPGSLQVLSGWQYELVGCDLLRLVRGELAIGVDPATGSIRVVEINQ